MDLKKLVEPDLIKKAAAPKPLVDSKFTVTFNNMGREYDYDKFKEFQPGDKVLIGKVPPFKVYVLKEGDLETIKKNNVGEFIYPLRDTVSKRV